MTAVWNGPAMTMMAAGGDLITSAGMHTLAYIHENTNVHKCVHVCIPAHTGTHTNTHIHTLHTHTQTHTHTRKNGHMHGHSQPSN